MFFSLLSRPPVYVCVNEFWILLWVPILWQCGRQIGGNTSVHRGHNWKQISAVQRPNSCDTISLFDVTSSADQNSKSAAWQRHAGCRSCGLLCNTVERYRKRTCALIWMFFHCMLGSILDFYNRLLVHITASDYSLVYLAVMRINVCKFYMRAISPRQFSMLHLSQKPETWFRY